MAMSRLRMTEDLDTLGDGDLATRASAGDIDAFETLYRRHAEAAWRVAHAVTRNADDAADAVADAFTKLLQSVPNGRLGDVDRFRSYLLATTRNVAIDTLRRRSRTQPSDTVATTATSATAVGAAAGMGGTPAEHLIDATDAALVASAFHTLPERWRSVLWMTEVEGIPAREVGERLGLSPNSAAALAMRARNGLRERYLQAHLQVVDSDECRRVSDQLGAYVGGALSARAIAKVDQHLTGCADCRARLAELEDVGSTLRKIIIPLPLLLAPLALHRYREALGLGGIGRSAIDGLTALGTRAQKPMVAMTTGVFALGITAAAVMGRGDSDSGNRRANIELPAASGAIAGSPDSVVFEPAAASIPDFGGLAPVTDDGALDAVVTAFDDTLLEPAVPTVEEPAAEESSAGAVDVSVAGSLAGVGSVAVTVGDACQDATVDSPNSCGDAPPEGDGLVVSINGTEIALP